MRSIIIIELETDKAEENVTVRVDTIKAKNVGENYEKAFDIFFDRIKEMVEGAKK
jgi:hypothetical protein